MRKLHLLLIFIPIALALKWFGTPPLAVFACSALALVPLASLMGDATEALATYLGATYGGLLNASLGNAPEIIISLFALKQGLVGIVKASITGSILGNLLLRLGLSMFVGGLKNGDLRFNVRVAKLNAGLLTLSAFGLIIPAVFDASSRGEAMAISPEIAGVLFALYLASVFLHHPHGQASPGQRGRRGRAGPFPGAGRRRRSLELGQSDHRPRVGDRRSGDHE